MSILKLKSWGGLNLLLGKYLLGNKLTLFITFTNPLSVCLELALARSSSVKFWCKE